MLLRTLMIVLALGGAVALGACVMEEPMPDELTEQALDDSISVQEESTQVSQADDELQPLALCPRRWTCDFLNYYSTKSQCTTACNGSTCFLDHHCDGTCICP